MTTTSTAARTGRPRVALYGHDTVGLGHLRRNLALAAALAGSSPGADVLVLSGAPEASRFRRPPGVDVVTLPSVDKLPTGAYVPGRLGLRLEEVVAIRAAVLRAALTAFDPHLLVVDKVPLGLGGELAPALRRLRARHATTTVLGLRDVLDDPRSARADWRTQRTTEALRRYFDEVWVYGDPRVHDLVEACLVPPGLRAGIHHVGYLAYGRVAGPADPPGVPTAAPYVVGLLGGGQDGGRLARTLAEVAARPGVPHVVLVGGPYLPAETLAAVEAQAGPGLTVVPFAEDPERWVARAEAVVAMGGYNTVCEILTTSTPALLVPRTSPRLEQWVRAERLSALDLVDVVHPDELSAGGLVDWLARVAGRRVTRGGRIDLGGLQAVVARAGELLGRAPEVRRAAV